MSNNSDNIQMNAFNKNMPQSQPQYNNAMQPNNNNIIHNAGMMNTNNMNNQMFATNSNVPNNTQQQIPQNMGTNNVGNMQMPVMNMASNGIIASGNQAMQHHNIQSNQTYVAIQPGMISQGQQILQPGMVMNTMSNNQGNNDMQRQMMMNQQPNGVPINNSMNIGNAPQQVRIQQQMPMQSNMMYNNNMQPNNMQPMQTVQIPSQTPQSSQIVGSSANGIGNTKIIKRSWHSPEHTQSRSNMVERIINLLKQRRPNATEDWHEKLPHMAKRLEEALYGQAEDLQQYSDTNTLKQRLQQLALSMGGKQAVRHNTVPGRGIPQQQQQAPQQQQAIPNQAVNHVNQIPHQNFSQPQLQQIPSGGMIQTQPTTGQQQGNYIVPNTGNNNQFPQVHMYNSNNMQPNVLMSQVSFQNNQMDQAGQHTVNHITPSTDSSSINNIDMQQRQHQYINHMPQMNNTMNTSITNNPNVGSVGNSSGTVPMQMQQQQMMNNTQTQVVQGAMHNIPQQNMQQSGIQQQTPVSSMVIDQSKNPQQPQRVMNYTPMTQNQLPNGGMMYSHPGVINQPVVQQHTNVMHTNSIIQQQQQPIQQQLHQQVNYSMNNVHPPIQQQQMHIQSQNIPMQSAISGISQHNVVPQTAPTLSNTIPISQQAQHSIPQTIPQLQSQPINSQAQAQATPQQIPTQPMANIPLNIPGTQISLSNPIGGGQSNTAHNEEHRRQVLKQQQQRLLLLRHASKCPHEAGRCPVTPHCANMKSLWKHIMGCKDQECKQSHCVSSRYVLSHYSKCKDQQCPVCGPVREAIRRNYERSKEIVDIVGKTSSTGGNVAFTTTTGTVPNAVPVAPAVTPVPPSATMPTNTITVPTASRAKSSGTTIQGIIMPVNGTSTVTTINTFGNVNSVEDSANDIQTPQSTTATKKVSKAGQQKQAGQSVASKKTKQDVTAAASGLSVQLPVQTSDSISQMVPTTSLIPTPSAISKPSTPIYPLDPISCAIYSFSPEQIQAHFKTIHEGMRLSASKIKESFLPVIDEILKLPNANSIFGFPVDPIALGLPDYSEVIKLPMDLGTIRKRLESSSYRDVSNLVSDVHLTFNNAMLYNPKGSDVHVLAKTLKREFDLRYKAVVSDIERNIDNNRSVPDACLICGEIKLLYEPPVYYCNGRCGGQRIRRAATYYSNKQNSYHWCSQCYNELKDGQIRLPDCVIMKSDLQKKKHSEDNEESWVQCEGPCGRWVHQICGLFNSRRNIGDECHFVCPNCLSDKRKKASLTNEIIVAPTTKKMKASDLPHCNLSQFIEKRIYERLEIAYKENATKRNTTYDEVEKCPPIFLRQVSCYDKNQHVREGVMTRYKHKNYPAELPCRTKCVILFQNIDGQDVILFGMYVYEYGHKCPFPNQRRVYISYLDSVHFFRPKQYRTLVYHEILISYLDYVKARGFHTAHIWACPPQKGDDYILYVHPPDQKTPRPDKLRNWYQDMLLASKARGIVLEITDLYSEFMADPNNDATVLPYFEGDYWVNEAEVIIKDLANPSSNLNSGIGSSCINDDNILSAGDEKSKRKTKSKRTARNQAKQLSIGYKASERDVLMSKLASIIEPMKDTFFVVRLHPKEYAEKFAKIRQEEILKESGGDVVTISGADQSSGDEVKIDNPSQSESENVEIDNADAAGDDDSLNPGRTKKRKGTGETGFGSPLKKSKDSETDDKVEDLPDETEMDVVNNESKEDSEPQSTTIADTDEKSNFEATVDDDKSALVDAKLTAAAGSHEHLEYAGMFCEVPRDIKDDTEDIDDVQESEHFDTRQSVLNLCQGNHYQFDQLRRAKYTSMMVLYHIHNPDAPKFVPSCSRCHKDILVGYRYRCEPCDCDFCQSCVADAQTANPIPGAVSVNTNPNQSARVPTLHQHGLQCISVGGGTAQVQAMTEEQRRERQRNIQLHMQLLQHAANCPETAECKSRNCMKMKDFLKHVSTCETKAAKGCRLCMRINNLLQLHARSCRAESCRVPHCHEIREHMRQMELLQQQMDDRRRTMINEKYRAVASGNSNHNSSNDIDTD